MNQVERGGIVRAFCWAQVRRDFLSVARSWPEQEGWAMSWVERIGELYRLNDARRAVREEATAFARADAELQVAVTAMADQVAAELAEPSPQPARRKVLESLGDHWTGLTVFVEHVGVVERRPCGHHSGLEVTSP